MLAYLLVEGVLSVWKGTFAWLTRQIFGALRRWWKELVYLSDLLRGKHTDQFVYWKPGTRRYVALRAIRALGVEDDAHPQPLLELLEKQIAGCQPVLVVGKPGSGKTTALEALTYRLAKQAYICGVVTWLIWTFGAALLVWWSALAALLWLLVFLLIFSRIRLWTIPFYLKLSTFSGPSAREFLAGEIKKATGDDGLLKMKGGCRFLLDGVNEVNRNTYDLFLETWRGKKDWPATIFTTRTNEEPNLEGITRLEVLELDDPGVKQFISVYLREKLVETQRKERGDRRFWRAGRMLKGMDPEGDFTELKRKGLLAEGGIGRNPYWLRMMVRSGVRTRNRGALLHGFVTELIKRETEVKPKQRARTPDWLIVPLPVEMEALGELALAMSQDGKVGFHGQVEWERGLTILRAVLDSLGGREMPQDIISVNHRFAVVTASAV